MGIWKHQCAELLERSKEKPHSEERLGNNGSKNHGGVGVGRFRVEKATGSTKPLGACMCLLSCVCSHAGFPRLPTPATTTPPCSN